MVIPLPPLPPDKQDAPIRIKLNKSIDTMWDILKADGTIFPYGRPRVQGTEWLFLFSEDFVKNFFHMVLIIVAFALLYPFKKGVVRKKKFTDDSGIYALLIAGSWCIFAYFIPWQPWVTRLQTPLFALSAPVFVLAFGNKTRLRKLSLILLISFSLFPLVLNRSRPLLSFPVITSSKTIWNTYRDDLVFNTRSADGSYKYGEGSYTDACAAIVQTGLQNLGLIMSGSSWEYPLWRYIRHNSDKKIRITHVMENDINSDIDVLFILDRETPNIIPNNEKPGTPLVLIRNSQDESAWSIIPD
jgi:hypothetical protein